MRNKTNVEIKSHLWKGISRSLFRCFLVLLTKCPTHKDNNIRYKVCVYMSTLNN